MGKNLSWSGSETKIPEHEPVKKRSAQEAEEEDALGNIAENLAARSTRKTVGLERWGGTNSSRRRRRRRRRRRNPILTGTVLATLSIFALGAYAMSVTGDVVIGMMIVGAGWVGWQMFGVDGFDIGGL